MTLHVGRVLDDRHRSLEQVEVRPAQGDEFADPRSAVAPDPYECPVTRSDSLHGVGQGLDLTRLQEPRVVFTDGGHLDVDHRVGLETPGLDGGSHHPAHDLSGLMDRLGSFARRFELVHPLLAGHVVDRGQGSHGEVGQDQRSQVAFVPGHSAASALDRGPEDFLHEPAKQQPALARIDVATSLLGVRRLGQPAFGVDLPLEGLRPAGPIGSSPSSTPPSWNLLHACHVRPPSLSSRRSASVRRPPSA